jgi:hypothetical protein
MPKRPNDIERERTTRPAFGKTQENHATTEETLHDHDHERTNHLRRHRHRRLRQWLERAGFPTVDITPGRWRHSLFFPANTRPRHRRENDVDNRSAHRFGTGAAGRSSVR